MSTYEFFDHPRFIRVQVAYCPSTRMFSLHCSGARHGAKELHFESIRSLGRLELLLSASNVRLHAVVLRKLESDLSGQPATIIAGDHVRLFDGPVVYRAPSHLVLAASSDRLLVEADDEARWVDRTQVELDVHAQPTAAEAERVWKHLGVAPPKNASTHAKIPSSSHQKSRVEQTGS